MLVSKTQKPYGDPRKKTTEVSKLSSHAISDQAKAEVEEVRKYLMNAVPDANLTEDFLVKVASTWSLSRKNPTVLDAAVKHLQK